MSSIQETPTNDQSFDYIIVGGGTAGLALAVRLSEDPACRVCVIEAGKHHKGVPEIDRPGYLGRTMFNPEFDWSFMSTPQEHANDRVIGMNRGKMLGGTSGLNFMSYQRASEVEYDGLEKLGNPGWNWQSLLPYFKKAETSHPWPGIGPELFKNISRPEFHGHDGPIQTSVGPWFTPTREMYLETLTHLGVPANNDQDDGDNVGFVTSPSAVNPKTATRSYAANAYYEPVSSRENLTVILEAQVTKVLFAQEVKPLVAVGVTYSASGKTQSLRASKEIILSAGTFQTPQILELSGVGRRDILQKLGIKQVLDISGVGENLHPSVETWDEVWAPEGHSRQEELYKIFQGIYTSTINQLAWLPLTIFGGDAIEDIKSLAKQSKSRQTTPEATIALQRDWLQNPKVAQLELMNYPGSLHPCSPVPGKSFATLISGIMHPFSRGSAHAGSADPLAAPVIDTQYYAEPADLAIALAGLRFADRIMKTHPYKSYFRANDTPSAEQLADDSKLADFARSTISPIYHPIGTASMLPAHKGGVVDSELRVYGTSNLRVVDLSILPIHLACHPLATAYAIAEKAADIIKGIKTV